MKGRLQALPLIGSWFMDITPEEVISFHTAMSDRYKVKVVQKDDSSFMKTVAWALDLMKILKKADFLKNFTTTIGRTIYAPYVPGVPSAGYDLWWQVETMAHECQHIHQYNESGATDFSWSYLTDHVQRASYEVEAYTVNLELYWWRYKKLLNVQSLANCLNSYGCTAGDVAVTAKKLGLIAASVRRGAIVSEASATAISWLNSNVPRLRAK